MKNIRNDFELLKDVTYLDSAAGALKPKVVIDAMSEFYNSYPINPHSIDSKLGVIVHNKIEETRELTAKLVGAKKEEIIFTSGTTDSINKFALMIEDSIEPGDEIVLSVYNHVSNLLPWIEMANATGAKVVISNNIIDDINEKTRIVSYAQENNTIAQHNDFEAIYKKANKYGAIVFNDAAQAIMHDKVELKYFDAIAFSSNKLYGPTGVGVLAIKNKILSMLFPSTYGGGAVATMNNTSWIVKNGVDGFEPGTPNTSGLIGFGAAIKYFNQLILDGLVEHENKLTNYCYDKLSKIDGIIIYSKKGDKNILFNLKGVHSQDVVSSLGHKNIIIKSGEHCAKLLKQKIDTNSSIRISFGAYNTFEDIDKLIDALKGGNFLDFI